MNSIQNPSSVTNPTMEPYCILLPLAMPYNETNRKLTNNLLQPDNFTNGKKMENGEPKTDFDTYKLALFEIH